MKRASSPVKQNNTLMEVSRKKKKLLGKCVFLQDSAAFVGRAAAIWPSQTRLVGQSRPELHNKARN